MLYVWQDHLGYIQGCVEWEVVDEKGKMAPDGEYIWVEQMKLNPGIDLTTALGKWIAEMGPYVPQVTTVYWQRRDRTGKKLHAYPIKKWARFARRLQYA